MLNLNPNTQSLRRAALANGVLLGLAVGALALGSAPPAAGSGDAETTAAESVLADALGMSPKGVRVVEGQASKLSVDIEPLRERYEVDEPIRFRVRGDSAFYVYLYSIDEETGDSELIFPNKHERDNHFPSGRSYLIPNRDAEFYSDRPGTEEVVMLASREPIDDPLTVLDGDGKALVSAADFERLLTSQGLRIERDDRHRLRDARTGDLLIKRLELTVAGEERSARPETDAPTALIGTAHDTYRAGERFEVVFGATTDGWVHLYVVEPGGAFERLTREEVKANRVVSESFRAEAPYGLHKLVAIYTSERQLDLATEADILGENGAVWVPDDDRIAVAVRRIRVLR